MAEPAASGAGGCPSRLRPFEMELLSTSARSPNRTTITLASMSCLPSKRIAPPEGGREASRKATIDPRIGAVVLALNDFAGAALALERARQEADDLIDDAPEVCPLPSSLAVRSPIPGAVAIGPEES